MTVWTSIISIGVAAFAIWQVRSYAELYTKTTGSNIGRTIQNRPLWIASLGVIGLGAPMIFDGQIWATAIWAICNFTVLAVSQVSWNLSLVLHAESHRHIQSRLEFLRSQLQRLEERSQLGTVLSRVTHSENALEKISDRFELILATIEHHLLMGDHEQAERIITLFARHLRQTLYEGSMPFLPLADTVEHIQTHFDLMHMLTGMRLTCDVDDGMLDELTKDRHTATFIISDWAQNTLWPYFQLAERSLEPLGNSTLNMDLIDDELVLSFSPPETMYLPEGASSEVITRRFKLLGDPTASPAHLAHRVASALAS